MLIGIFLSKYYVDKASKDLLNSCLSIEDNLTNKDFDTAYLEVDRLLENWDNESNSLSFFIHHAELDNINIELYKLSQYIKYEEETEALASLNAIKYLFGHLGELEKPSLKNIL